MPFMNEHQIAQFEARLEQLVEGVFTNIFHKRLSAHDIALKVVRSLEANLLRQQDGDDQRLVAPNEFHIHIHPDNLQKLLEKRPDLAERLEEQIVTLVAHAGYRLLSKPYCQFVASHETNKAEVHVSSRHSNHDAHSTAVLKPIRPNAQQTAPANPQLIINGTRTIPLSQNITNIGRSDDNDIVIDDPFISRHHIQIRLRDGVHMLFDIHSKGGTLINNVALREHKLQSGDVIRIGNTQIIYVVDESPGHFSPGTTQSFDPIDL